MNNLGLSDREILDDILTSQKHITSVYDTFSNECVSKQLQSDMLNILNSEHKIQFDVFSEMQKRGWYAPAAAEQEMINQAKTKFESISTEL